MALLELVLLPVIVPVRLRVPVAAPDMVTLTVLLGLRDMVPVALLLTEARDDTEGAVLRLTDVVTERE